MPALDRLAWAILNATADDCENLEQIYRQLSYELLPHEGSTHPWDYDYRPVKGAPSLGEIADRIRNLVEAGLLTVVMDAEGRPLPERKDLSYVWRGWFAMTPAGRSAWESSEHLVSQEEL